MFVVLCILVSTPSPLVAFTNTFLGKTIFVLAIIVISTYSTLSGLFAVLVFIYLSESTIEGMSTIQSTADIDPEKVQADNLQSIISLRKKHCKVVKGEKLFVDSSGATMSLKDMRNKYPHVQFDSNCPNQCDTACDTPDSDLEVDQLTTEESIRPINSIAP